MFAELVAVTALAAAWVALAAAWVADEAAAVALAPACPIAVFALAIPASNWPLLTASVEAVPSARFVILF